MYPGGASTFVEVAGLSDRLDGASRPGHFRGVATVVAKLFIAAEPDRAFFGQKDAAQVAVLQRMVADLKMATEIVVCPIVREADGLALSSRNVYLTATERAQALVLSRAVRKVEDLFAAGERSSAMLIEAAKTIFAAEASLRVDYIELVDWGTLLPVVLAVPGSLFAVAAYVGATRLIDNAVLGEPALREILYPGKLEAARSRALCQPKLSFSPVPTPPRLPKSASDLLKSAPRLPIAKRMSRRLALS
jgi:pantoate--beta-alanine ligase